MVCRFREGQRVRIVGDPVGQYNGFGAVILDCDHTWETGEPTPFRSRAQPAPCYTVRLTTLPNGSSEGVPRVRLHLPETALEVWEGGPG